MRYHFTPITEAEARLVLSWRYPGIATLYRPDPDEMEEDVAALVQPEYHYHAARSEEGDMVGFCCFGEDAQVPGGDYALPAVDIGLGLHPDLTGKGLAHGFLAAILTFADELFAPEFYRATVAVINKRSLHLFERAGFYIVQTFVSGEVKRYRFYVLLRAAQFEDRVSDSVHTPAHKQ